jgi:hypothetical protein
MLASRLPGLLPLSFANIDPEKFKQLLATHIYGEAHLPSAVPLNDQMKKSV